MNVPLLEQIKVHITEEPRRLRMGDWGFKVKESMAQYPQYPPCGTVGCISGWGILLSKKNDGFVDGDYGVLKLVGNSFRAGMEVLDLTEEQANRLFYVDGSDEDAGWPEQFRRRYYELHHTQYAELAELTADRIDFFIKTNGTDKE